MTKPLRVSIVAALLFTPALVYAAADPSIAVSEAGDAGWSVFKTDGPLWAALLIVSGLLRTFISKQHWLAQGKVLSGLTGASMVIAAVLAWHFTGAPASGVFTALFAAYTLVTHSTVPGAAPSTASTSAVTTVVGVVVIGGLLSSLSAASGCATAKGAERGALADVVSCTTADREALYRQFGPTMEQVLQRATDATGKIDLPSLQSVTASLKADGWCVVRRAAAQLIASALGAVGGTQSAAAPLDVTDLAGKLSTLQVAKFGSTRFELAP